MILNTQPKEDLFKLMMKEVNKIERPPQVYLLLETRTLLELGMYFFTIPVLQNLTTFPKGDGHPILVLPGFMASDISTIVLRNFLQGLGYRVYPWKLGRNLAHYEELETLMAERVLYLKKKHNRNVSIIGWSLGGVYARELAKALPNDVRQVITLGSPFGGINQNNNIEWVVEWITGRKVQEIDNELVEKILKTPPVPTTAIFTRTDGIVSWQACIEKEEGPITENLEVLGSHCGLGHNPMVLMYIAERLAQKEGEWVPFKKKYGQK